MHKCYMNYATNKLVTIKMIYTTGIKEVKAAMSLEPAFK